MPGILHNPQIQWFTFFLFFFCFCSYEQTLRLGYCTRITGIHQACRMDEEIQSLRVKGKVLSCNTSCPASGSDTEITAQHSRGSAWRLHSEWAAKPTFSHVSCGVWIKYSGTCALWLVVIPSTDTYCTEQVASLYYYYCFYFYVFV